MERFELKWIMVYTGKIAYEEGNPGALNKAERDHLKLLLRKYELEQQSAELDADMSQAKMAL